MIEKSFITSVNKLEVGHHAIINKITASSKLKQRLLSFGFIRGNAIRLVSYSLVKKTFVVNVGEKSQFALRGEEAKHILVRISPK